MINKKCYSSEWLDLFKKQPEHRKIDKIILEKMIYALHLLEQLQVNGLDFVFKGGTSLVLLLDEGNRFSIDIDIICNTEREDLEAILHKVTENSEFQTFELDEKRSYQPGIPKANYAFKFDSSFNKAVSGKILLDVLIESSIYPELVQVPIQTKWIETDETTLVNTPSIDSITGDKLTAFAPNTTGIPYYKGNQSFAMEICKQLFDLSKLFEKIQNLEVVDQSFRAFAEQEILYRGNNGKDDVNLTWEKVLEDTLETCLIITRRGTGTESEKEKFKLLQKGIKAFGTGYLMTGNFRIDDAISAVARVAYLVIKVLTRELSPIEFFNGQDIKDWNIEDPEWNFLNRLKKQPDKSSFYYWYQAVSTLRK